MAHVYADRVREDFTSTGPGDFTLAGPQFGYVGFAARIGVGNTTHVTARDPASGEWETCLVTVLSATQLQRGAFIASTTGARISFASGVKEVFCCLPAIEAMRRTEIEGALDLKLDADQLSPFGLVLVGDANAAGARGTLGLGELAVLDDAPENGAVHGRQNGAWQEIKTRATVETVSTTTHIPAVGVDGRYFVCTHASGCSVTIPANAAQAFPIGTMLTYQADDADSPVTFAPDTGVTLRVPASRSAATAEQYAVVQVAKVATDTWVLYGNLAAA